jgi:hypothetical protein
MRTVESGVVQVEAGKAPTHGGLLDPMRLEVSEAGVYLQLEEDPVPVRKNRSL